MNKVISSIFSRSIMLCFIGLLVLLSGCGSVSTPKKGATETSSEIATQTTIPPSSRTRNTDAPSPTPPQEELSPVIHKISDLPGGNYLVLLQAKWVDDSTITQVVFQEYRENANGETYLKNPIVILRMVEGISEFSAAMNSNGTKIVIVPYDVADFFAIVNLLDASVQRIEINRNNCADPSWNPAGDQILLECDRDDGIPELFLFTLEDQRFEQITDCASGEMACGMGIWSPDETWISFQKAGFGSGEHETGLYTIPETCLRDPQTCPQNERYISKDLSGYLAWLEDGRSAIILGDSGFQRCEILSNGDFSCVNEPVPGVADFSDVQGGFQVVDGENLIFLNSDDQMMWYSLETREITGLIRNHDNSSILGQISIP